MLRVLLFLFSVSAISIYWVPADAQMRMRKSIQRSIQKNVEIAVKRKKLKLNVRESAGSIEFLEISPDHRFVLTLSEDRKFRLWDFALGRQILIFDQTAPQDLIDITLSKDGQKFVTLNNKNETTVWSFEKNKENIQSFKLPDDKKASAFSFSPNGALLVAGTLDGHVYMFDARNLTLQSKAKVTQKAIQNIHIQQDNLLMVVTSVGGEANILETNSGALVWASAQGGLTEKFTSVHFGQNPNILVAGTQSGKVLNIDTSNGSVQDRVSLDKPIRTVNVSQGGLWNLAYGEGNAVYVWETGKEEAIKKIEAHPEGLNSARFVGEAPFLLSAGKDKVSKLWRMDSGTPVLSLVSTKDGWAVVDDKGRYDGSDLALKNIDWAAETDLLAIDNFVDEFYEPGLMFKRRFDQELIANPPSLEEGILPTPVVTIDVPKSVNLNETAEIDVTLTVQGHGGGIKDVRLYMNYKRVPAEAEMKVEKSKGEDGFEVMNVTYRIKPGFGNNELTAQARSSEDIYGVTASQVFQGEGEVRKPRLHVVAIGVNNYYEEVLNLNYALSDAEGISSVLSQLGTGIFDEVVYHPVFDQAATRDGIMATLEKVKAQTTSADVVAIYMSGHGESVDDQFYFVPYEFKNPFTPDSLVRQGLPGKDVQEMILEMNAQRVLWVLDTCKSGSALNSFAAARDNRSLRRLGVQLGIHVISATAKNQYAVEFDEIGHGVFTYTLLLALQGSADLVNVDKRISVKEAATFLENMVPQLSNEYANHQQWPMVYSSGFDFVLSKVE